MAVKTHWCSPCPRARAVFTAIISEAAISHLARALGSLAIITYIPRRYIRLKELDFLVSAKDHGSYVYIDW